MKNKPDWTLVGTAQCLDSLAKIHNYKVLDHHNINGRIVLQIESELYMLCVLSDFGEVDTNSQLLSYDHRYE